jgi:hypothetical protein
MAISRCHKRSAQRILAVLKLNGGLESRTLNSIERFIVMYSSSPSGIYIKLVLPYYSACKL